MSRLLTLVWPEKLDLDHLTQTMSQQDGTCQTVGVLLYLNLLMLNIGRGNFSYLFCLYFDRKITYQFPVVVSFKSSRISQCFKSSRIPQFEKKFPNV